MSSLLFVGRAACLEQRDPHGAALRDVLRGSGLQGRAGDLQSFQMETLPGVNVNPGIYRCFPALSSALFGGPLAG